MNKRLVVAIPMLLAVLSVSGGAYAAGGFQLGPASVSPGLGITAKKTSNIYLDSDDTTSDWVTTVSPSLALRLPVSRFYLDLTGQLDWVNYADNSSENSVNWNASGAVGADFTKGLSFLVKTTYADRYLVRTQEFGEGEDSATGDTQVKVSYKIRDTYRLELSWARTSYLFENSDNRERDEDTYRLGLFWRFQPRLSALLEGGWTGYTYDSNTAQDGHAPWLNLGLTWDISDRSSGFAKAGYQWKYYDVTDETNGIESSSYSTVGLGLRHHFTSRTSISAEVARASVESDFPDNPYYLRTSLGASLEQRFGRRFNVGLSVKYVRDEYPEETTFANAYDVESVPYTGKRADTTVGGGISVGFQVLRWLSLGVSVTTESRSSNFETFDYTNTLLGVDIAAKF